MDFLATIQAAGLRPRRTPVPGAGWKRCPTEGHPRKLNGAYCLAADGLVGWWQDWSTDAEPNTWRPERTSSGAAHAPVSAAEIRRRQQQEAAERARASAAARTHYETASPLVGGHPYLQAHGLDMAGCRGLRVDAHGWLVVPMRRCGQVVSVQRISPEGDKKFWPGAPTAACGYAVDRTHTTVMVLCEGLATGLALYAAVPGSRVVVGFNAGNLPRVAAALPRRGLVVVAADNDHETEARIGRNPGVQYAREAAAVLGCGVAVPEGIAGTDWCDFRAERLAALLEPVYGRRPMREGQARRAVDGEIRDAVLRSAVYLRRAG